MGRSELAVETLVFALPEVADSAFREAHWWLVAEGAIVEAGVGAEWPGLASDAAGQRRRLVALAPIAAVRLAFAPANAAAASPRQAAVIARVAAVEQSLGDSATLHSARAALPDGRLVTALVANGTMLEWIDWATALGVDPDHIVPVATLLPLGEQWVSATIGADTLVGRGEVIMPFEPALAEAIVGDSDITELSAEEIAAALVVAAEARLIDLRSGRFARRRRIVIERGRIRELIALACLIPLLTLLWAIVSIVKLNSSSDRLDAETLRLAEATIGRTPALETAAADMAQVKGGGSGGLSVALTALFQKLQAEPGISTTQLGYSGNGTLQTTLAAPTVDEINRLLLALQRDGYKVTAVPRQAPDGRSMVDITVRSGP